MSDRRAYPSDLSDACWALIAPRLTAWRQARTDARTSIGVKGRTPTHDLREIFNAILYVNRTDIAWRYLPHDSLHMRRSMAISLYGAKKGSSPNSTIGSPDSSATTTAEPSNRPRRSWTHKA